RLHTKSKRDWSSDVCSSDLTLVGNSSGKTADIGPKIRPIKNMPMVKKSSTEPSVAESMGKNWVNVKPKTMISAETVAKIGLRPTLSGKMDDTGMPTMKAKIEINWISRKSV